jgi:SAM-dependent methyltransferase
MFYELSHVRGDSMMWGQKRTEELIARLERRIDQLDQRIAGQLSLQNDRGRRTEEQLAELRERLGASATEVAQLQQRAAADMVAEMRRLETLVSEARADVVATRGQLAATVGLSEQVFALTSRLDADVVAGFAAHNKRLESDLVILAGQSRQLGGDVSQLAEFVQRLDHDVGQGFASVSQRLEKDLVLLADRTHQLESALNRALPQLIQYIQTAALNRYGLGPGSDQEAEPVQLKFPSCLQQEYPREFKAAWAATNTILDTIPTSDLIPLARHSPGLRSFDWTTYIRLSSIRMVRVGAALREIGLREGKVLDFGSYFGNFSLFAKKLGFGVDAADRYAAYGQTFEKVLPILRSAGIQIIDLGDGPMRDLGQIPDDSYDAVLCLGVIEHVPHTPKLLLHALNRVLRPGGALILDTPNLSYIYNREKLALGHPIAAPIQDQFDVNPPFEGHHREYTSEEMVWMLQQIGHDDIHVEMFNYSAYFLPELRGADAERFRRMERDPQLRELIMTRSTKPKSANVNGATNSPRLRRPSRLESGGRKRS